MVGRTLDLDFQVGVGSFGYYFGMLFYGCYLVAESIMVFSVTCYILGFSR